MARAHVLRPITTETGDLLYGAQVLVRESAMSVPINQPIYAAATGTDTLPNPFVTSSAMLDFWLDVPQRISVLIQKDGHSDILVYLDAPPPPEETARTDSPLQITGAQLPGRVLLAGSTPGQATWADPPTNSGVTPLVSVIHEQFGLAADPTGWTFVQSAATRDYPTEVPSDQGYTHSLHMVGTGNVASLVARTPGFTLAEPGYVSCWLRPNLAAGEQVVVVVTNNVGARTVLETITGVRPWGFYRYGLAAGTYQSMSVEYTGAATLSGSSGHEVWTTDVHATYGGQVPTHTHSGVGANSVLLGTSAVASAADSIAVGHSASATGTSSTAVGNGAQASGSDAIAIGSGAQAANGQDIAIGHSATGSVTAASWTAIGDTAYSDSANGTAIGQSASVYSDSGTAVGSDAYVSDTADSGVAIGDAAQVRAFNGVAIGINALVDDGHADSVAIGRNASSTAALQVVLGDTSAPYMSIVVGNKLYAVSAVQLGTDATSRLGFFGAEGTNKPTVTGSTGGIAALQNVLGALAGLGLITNSTS